MASKPSCVLAYSGGLDTSAIVPWLIDRGYDVHALAVDVGQREDWDEVARRARALGAASFTVRDARAELATKLLPTAVGLSAVYEGNYRLGTALARPVIALEQVRLARELGCKALAHGATGKGNDQVRFEFAYRSLAPECEVIAPWKEWSFRGRSDLAAYLEAKSVEIAFEVDKTYSLDENLWHLSVEGGPLEDAGATLDVPAILGRFVPQAAHGPDTVAVGFEGGLPVALDGVSKDLASIVAELNRRYLVAGWAWDLVLENRFTGIKSRGIYLNPAAKLLHLAADTLARACLNKPTYDLRAELSRRWAELIYCGEYFTRQRVVVEAAAGAAMEPLNGTVILDVRAEPHAISIDADEALFRPSLATFEASEYSHAAAAGFIELSWLRNVARPAPEEVSHESTVEADGRDPSGAGALAPMPGGGLVSAAP